MEMMMISPAFWLRYANVDLKKVKENVLSLPKCFNNCKIEFFDISSS
uniref:Uncharacterized protein n=1 Tax=Medicago truncatula TaxID=3880 RepID=I3T210_MEDTR|nr:unknown [Medicago truncatula]